MNLNKDIEELLKQGIISTQTADSIEKYYSNKKKNNLNKQNIIFAIIGSILVGLGLISIIAHNWDNMGKAPRLFIAFIPLVMAQLLALFTLIKRPKSKIFTETSTILLSFAVIACISLVSQTYNIMGNLESFILTCMLLLLPLVYIFKSNSVSILYILATTWYTWIHSSGIGIGNNIYLLLILLIVPHYYSLYKNHKHSNIFKVHSWLMPISLLISLPSLHDDIKSVMIIAYICLFSIFVITGDIIYKNNKNNSYSVIGSLSLVISFMIMSFDSVWKGILKEKIDMYSYNVYVQYIIAALMIVAAIALLTYKYKKLSIKEINLLDISFALFTLIYTISIFNTIAAIVLTNILLLAIGIGKINQGIKKDDMSIFNFGLITILILIACRFFDIDLSFVFRGILFITLGISFFAINYYMIKKIKRND